MDRSWWRVLTKHGPLDNGKSLQYSCLENPMNSMKSQKDLTLKDELPKSVDAIGEKWRNSSRRNEEDEPKQKKLPAVGVSGGESRVLTL